MLKATILFRFFVLIFLRSFLTGATWGWNAAGPEAVHVAGSVAVAIRNAGRKEAASFKRDSILRLSLIHS